MIKAATLSLLLLAGAGLGAQGTPEATRARTRLKRLLEEAGCEVEDLFKGSILVRIQRHLLLRPECIQGLRPLAGNRALALVDRGLELEVSRAATARLKELMGIKGEFGKREA